MGDGPWHISHIFFDLSLPPTVLKSCPNSVANDRRRVESSLPHLQTRRGGRIISNAVKRRSAGRGCQKPGTRLRPGDQVPYICKGTEYLMTTLQEFDRICSCLTCVC